MKSTGEAWDLFTLAICQWHMGRQEEARRSYDQAIEYMEQQGFGGLPVIIALLLRNEAAELLGIDIDTTDTKKDTTE